MRSSIAGIGQKVEGVYRKCARRRESDAFQPPTFPLESRFAGEVAEWLKATVC